MPTSAPVLGANRFCFSESRPQPSPYWQRSLSTPSTTAKGTRRGHRDLLRSERRSLAGKVAGRQRGPSARASPER